MAEGLRTGTADQDGDGQVTVDEAHDYAHRQVIAAGTAQTPQRWSSAAEGRLILARNPVGVPIRPAPLTEALQAALDNPLPQIRIGAVHTLAEWLRDPAVCVGNRRFPTPDCGVCHGHGPAAILGPVMDAAQPGLLQLAVEQTDAGAVVVTALGEIDISTAEQLKQTLSQVLDTATPGGPLSGVAVLDLSQVSFLDSTGLAALVVARAHATGLGRAWRLCGLQHTVERVLVITGLSEVFGIYPDLQAAVLEPLP